MESYATAAEAADSPLASALFAVPGVANIFVVPDFVTITKEAPTNWDDIWPAVEAALLARPV